jgi:hypothetical protein
MNFWWDRLRGHVYPNDPWVHVEKVSFRPTENLEFGFERSAIWGGKLHAPITLHTFLRSFFSLTAPTTAASKIQPTTLARASAHSTFPTTFPDAQMAHVLYRLRSAR